MPRHLLILSFDVGVFEKEIELQKPVLLVTSFLPQTFSVISRCFGLPSLTKFSNIFTFKKIESSDKQRNR